MKRALFILLFPTLAHAGGNRSDSADVDVRVDTPVTVEAPAVTVETPVTVDVPVDVTTPVDARTSVDAPVTVTNKNSTEIVNPDDIKVRNTPSVGLATPRDSVGFTFAIPGFATGVNLPWSFGDRKLLPIYDRLMASGDFEEANAVMCLTSVMKKVFDDEDLCTTALNIDASPGGGAPEIPKTDTVYETAGDEAMLVAEAAAQEELDRFEQDIEELQLLIDRQQRENRRLYDMLQQQEQRVIDDGAERRRRALEELKKGGYDPEDKKWQSTDQSQ